MKASLDKIRTPVTGVPLYKKILSAGGVLLAGILLGVFSKWLDCLSIDDAIAWQHFPGALDLGNRFSEMPVWILLAVGIAVFSSTPTRAALHVLVFFTGMTVSYHLYSIHICGFNPQAYMMLWYGITAVSPIPAFLCWYAKGKGKTAFVLQTLILAVMMKYAFSIGPLFFDFEPLWNILCLCGTAAILWKGPRTTGLSMICACAVRCLFSMLCYL